MIFNKDNLTDKELSILDCAIYEQIITLIRAQCRQKSSKEQYELDILQNLRIKISKWQHFRCCDKGFKENG